MIMRRGLVLLTTLLIAGCDDDGLTIEESAVGGVLAGVVLDAASDPVAGARIDVVGVVFGCLTQGGSIGDFSETADSEGRFTLSVSLFLASPGEHCLDVAVSDSLGNTEPFDSIPVLFYASLPRDTTRVQLSLSAASASFD
jgi:hypothetical protein